MDTVFGSKSRFRSGSGFMEGLSALINLITVVEPMVMVLDEVDGLSSDSDSALRAASCLTSLWEASPRLSVILSINDDVWDSAFAPRLPLGLKDRLEDVVVRLSPLTQEQARALVTVRAGDEASKVLNHLDFENGELYPRDVLRKSREAWEKRDQVVEPKISDDAPAPVAELPKPAPTQPAAVVYTPAPKAPEVAPEPEPSPEEESSVPPVVEAVPPVREALTPSAEPAGFDPKSFKTHPSHSLDLELESGMESDFAQASAPSATETVESPFSRVTPVSVYPPLQVKRVELPKPLPVQRLVAALSLIHISEPTRPY